MLLPFETKWKGVGRFLVPNPVMNEKAQVMPFTSMVIYGGICTSSA